jgi:ribosomal protein S18 acetylase RimI-like enzyme
VIEIRLLGGDQVERVDEVLPLSRLDAGGEYLVAWEDDEPVGHAHLASSATELGVPEIQDVYVLPERRRAGIATALTRAAEQLYAERGHDRVSLSVGIGNEAARQLYERLGYADAGIAPKRVHGTILIRGEPFEVDDTLAYLVKQIAVDLASSRSS